MTQPFEVTALAAHDREVRQLRWHIADLQADLDTLMAKRPALLAAAQDALRAERDSDG